MAAKSILNDAFVMTEPTHKPIKKKTNLKVKTTKLIRLDLLVF